MPNMSLKEKKTFCEYLGSASRYLEFGSGKSTLLAVQNTAVKEIISVESDPAYVKKNLLPDKRIASAVKNGRLRFHFVDIGETEEWGYPVNESKKCKWAEYSSSVFRKASKSDLVLIDGRFRVACVLNCLLRMAGTPVLIIHDFWNRPYYHLVLEFLKEKDRIDTMGVFLRGTINRRRIKKLINQYQYFPC